MGRLTHAPDTGDVFLKTAYESESPARTFKTYLFKYLVQKGIIQNEKDRLQIFSQGAWFPQKSPSSWKGAPPATVTDIFDEIQAPLNTDLVFMAAPSIRFFDGRSANLPWLCEIPDPLTKIAWQTPVVMSPR